MFNSIFTGILCHERAERIEHERGPVLFSNDPTGALFICLLACF